MRLFFREALRFHHFLQRRFLPNFRLNRWFPFWDSVYLSLHKRATADYVDDVLGHKMFLDERDSLALSINPVYEPVESQLLIDQIKAGNVVLDVGANIGYYTLQFARKVGEAGRVFAFEPDSKNFVLLAKNIQINGYCNVTLVNQAVSDATGDGKLFLSEENKGDHRIYQGHEARPSLEIQMTRLDDYFDAIDLTVDCIKMDIQGAEYRALLGMQKLLTRNVCVVLVTEFWPYGLRRSGAEPQAYLDLLLALGFELFEIDEADGHLRPVQSSALMQRLADNLEGSTNLLCKRKA